MIRVKDVTRLKAFGYENMSGFKAKIVGGALICVDDENSNIRITGAACVELAEELFDLQAAGLLERVKENGYRD